MKTAALACSLALGVTLAAGARAQSRSGFAINRFEPAERGSEFFVVDSLDLRSSAAAGATFDYSYKPLVLYDAQGEEHSALVRHQAIVHLGGSLVVAKRLRLGIDAPIAVYQDGESAVVNGAELTGATAPSFGDIRLAADVRLFGEPGELFVVAAGARVWLPTGLRSQFTSDGSMRVAPQVLVAGTLSAFTWGARLALVYRSRDDDYAGRDLGSELYGAVGAGVRAWRIVVGPELYGASAFSSVLGKRETPLEALLGAHCDLTENLRVGVGLGSGLGVGYGTPQLRGLLSVEWRATPEREVRPPSEETKDVWEGVSDQPMSQRPLAVVTETEIHIEEELRFATDSADLVAESDGVLSAVKRILDEHPEIRRIRIEGHTDASGDPTYNDDLSARRAAAVQSWLIRHGISPDRLESVGRGSKDPVDTNDTEAGRAKNRRVVFKIVARDGS